ncbi:MAG: glucosaminidase domain-containing protein [Rhodospirillales bacterium]
MKPYQACHIVALAAMIGLSMAASVMAPPAAQTAVPRPIPEASLITDAGWAMPVVGSRDRPAAGRRPTVEALSRTFADLDYDLGTVIAGEDDVPRLFLARLPADIDAIDAIATRKALFVQTVLPLVLQANEEIDADRRRLWEVRYRLRMEQRLDAVDRLWLIVTAERYGVAPDDLDALARRVDVIPTSLALAQAVIESGWGTSRFVREGNALFGQRTFTGSGDLVPERREEGRTHRVRVFPTLLESVRAYAFNLNTHPVYGAFRDARASMRRDGVPLDSLRLAGYLDRYAEDGQRYPKALRTLIETNDLGRFDQARLRHPGIGGAVGS